jgi:hypothetical protein
MMTNVVIDSTATVIRTLSLLPVVMGSYLLGVVGVRQPLERTNCGHSQLPRRLPCSAETAAAGILPMTLSPTCEPKKELLVHPSAIHSERFFGAVQWRGSRTGSADLADRLSLE